MWFLPLKQNHPLDTQGTRRPPTYFSSNNQFSLEWNNLVTDGVMILILTLCRRNQLRCFQKGKLWKCSVDIWVFCHWIDQSVTWDCFGDFGHLQAFTFDALMIHWFSSQLTFREYMNPLKETFHSLVFHSSLALLDLFTHLRLLSFDCPTTSHW